MYIHRETMGLGGGVSSLVDEGPNFEGGGEIFGDDEISVSNFRFLPQIFGRGILLPMSKIPPPNGSLRARCGYIYI